MTTEEKQAIEALALQAEILHDNITTLKNAYQQKLDEEAAKDPTGNKFSDLESEYFHLDSAADFLNSCIGELQDIIDPV